LDLITILLIAVGLALDATAVSISRGIQMSCFRWSPTLSMAFLFAGFQMLMPVLGWYLGTLFIKIIAAFDHWVAFFLLLFVGLKMIFEKKQSECQTPESLIEVQSAARMPEGVTLFLLAVATSIDAFAVGLTFSLLKVELLLPILIIGLVTFTLSFLGTLLGQKCSTLLPKKVELIGGLILIAIGLKILLEHIF